ncbi:MAG: signal peptide peptidase SppA [Candidatus Riflebacteria bacterium]|nr:signal peptide peptidase SppA [Candidatus Riflebacteria bacterium]
MKKYKLFACVTIFIFILSSQALNAQSILDALLGKSEVSSKDKLKVKYIEGDSDVQEEILLINISGVIQEENDDGMPMKPSKNIIEELKKDLEILKKRASVKGAIIEINSPGGEVTCSDIMFHLIKKANKETGKPIVAIIGSMGTSGAYYVACGANKIYAHPTSIIGSIGVIMQSINIERLSQMIGVKPVVLKSERTPMKDILSPYRELTEQERESLLLIVNNIYDRFIKIVAESRKLPIEDVVKLADGRIYTADKAKETALIDEIGYREDAFKKACELAGIEKAALVKRIVKKGLGDLLGELEEINSGLPSLKNELKTLIETSGNPKIMLR